VVAALWVIAVGGAILLVLGPGRLWSNGGGDSPVATYIKNVNQLEQEMSGPLGKLLADYRAFSKLKSDPAERRKLTGAETTLRTFERRLAAIPAPPEALRLRQLIGEFVRDEDRVAFEIGQLARLIPRFDQLVAVAGIANANLARRLKAIPSPKAHTVQGTAKHVAAVRAAYSAALGRTEHAQAAAVDQYDSALSITLERLRTLHPPAVFAPAFTAELHTLEATTVAGAALAAALRDSSSKDVPALGRLFTEASRLSGTVGAQRAEIAAVKAYNARVRSIAKVESRIRAEVTLLQQRG
jgi:hypothetical protein